MSYRIKLDENFSPQLTEVFLQAGYDAHSVQEENLSGSPDEDLYTVVLRENRCLITFDLDFCNVLRYPSSPTKGIIVVRPHRPLSIEIIRRYAEGIVELLKTNNPERCLWVLEPGRLRIRRPRE